MRPKNPFLCGLIALSAAVGGPSVVAQEMTCRFADAAHTLRTMMHSDIRTAVDYALSRRRPSRTEVPGLRPDSLADELYAYHPADPISEEVRENTGDIREGLKYMTGEEPKTSYPDFEARVGKQMFRVPFLRSHERFAACRFNRLSSAVSPFKVYLTLRPEKVRADLKELVELAEKSGADAMKFGVRRLDTADRVVIHFGDFEGAQKFANRLAEKYANTEGDWLPFTHRVGGRKSPVFLGVDETKGNLDPNRRSWRARVTEVIGEATLRYTHEGVTGVTREEYIETALRMEGIDPVMWLPTSYVSYVVPPTLPPSAP